MNRIFLKKIVVRAARKLSSFPLPRQIKLMRIAALNGQANQKSVKHFYPSVLTEIQHIIIAVCQALDAVNIPALASGSV